MTRPKRRPPLGQTIGGVLFGFEQQVLRNVPPPEELVHHARPDDPVPAGDGTMLTITLPGDPEPRASLGSHRSSPQPMVTRPMHAEPGVVGDRPAPAGLPDPRLQPPVIAESGDPFSALRVLDLVARMHRGRAVRVDDLVDRLNATYPDWLFTRPVVVDVLVALQANWMADYRNSSGIVLEDGALGATVTLEDTSRVDPWIVGQAQREAAECRRQLDEFARRDHRHAGG